MGAVDKNDFRNKFDKTELKSLSEQNFGIGNKKVVHVWASTDP